MLKSYRTVERHTHERKLTSRSFHVFVEEGDDSFRMPSEVIVSVLEAPRGTLDPEQFLFLATQQIEGLLRVLGIPCPGVF